VPLAIRAAVLLPYSKNSFAAYPRSWRAKPCLPIVGTLILLILLAGSSAFADPASKADPWLTPEGGNAMALSISSPSFASGGEIPKKFTCDAADVSPQLVWTEPPSGTKSFALLVDDPDAPVGNWNHWTMWNLPPNARGLPEEISKEATLPDGTQQGRNDFRKTGYNGPCPPPGKPHRYYFKLFALDTKLDLKPGASKHELEAAMKGHILAQAEWMGRYGR
jgi:Raf kinase inhibitor-like YbhB/YbcL family protein